MKIALVAWVRVCMPNKYGGLNVKCCQWNTVVVGKLVWQVVCKKDMLWVKLVT